MAGSGQYPPNISLRVWGHNYQDLAIIPQGKRNAAPLLVGKFAAKAIGQSSDRANSNNIITVTIMTNVDLFPSSEGTRIEFVNLVETNTASTAALPISGNSTVLFGTSGAWDKDSGTLSLVLQETLPLHVSFVVQFTLVNPSQFQESPDVSIGVSGGLTPFPYVLTDKADQNKAPIFVSGFPIAFISQSNPLVDQENNITISFSTNNPLLEADNSQITISGILNGRSDSKIRLHSTTHDVNSLFSDGQSPGHAHMDLTTFDLTINIIGDIDAQQQYTFSFTLINPSFNQAPGEIKIQGSGTADLASTPMSSPNSKLVGIEDGSNPLKVVVPAFEVTASQSRPIINESNTISVIIRSNTNLEFESYVALSGLKNAIAPEVVSLQPKQIDSLVGLPWHKAAASQSAFVQSLTAPCFTIGGTVPAQTPCAFPFEYNGTSYSECTEWIPGERGIFWCSTTSEYDGWWGECVCDASIFGSMFQLAAGEAALAGSNLWSSGDVSIGSGGTASFTTRDSLVLGIVPNMTMRAGLRYQFSFDVQNPLQAQQAPALFVEANGTALYPLAPVTLPNQPVIGVLNGSNPMLVERPLFLERKITQSVPLGRYLNKFVVTLQTNVDLTGGDSSVLTIRGLEDAQGDSSIEITAPTEGNADKLFADADGNPGRASFACPQIENSMVCDGTVRLYLVANQTLHAFTRYIFAFQLTQPSGIRAVGAIVRINARGTAQFDQVVMKVPNQELYGVANGSNPMVRVDQNFDTREIWQASPIAGLNNTIYVILSPSINLDWDSRSSITITGIDHAINPEGGSLLRLEGDIASVFSPFPNGTRRGFGEYEQNVLTLYLADGQTMNGGQLYAFHFRIINPGINQPAGDVEVSAQSSAGALQSIAPRDMIFPRTDPVLGVVGGAIPLTCVVPSFVRSLVAQSNPLASNGNILTVSLIANVELSALEETNIIIRGFRSVVLPKHVTLLSTEHDNVTAIQLFDAVYAEDTLNLTLKGNTTMSANVIHEFAFEVSNPAAEQPASELEVEAGATPFARDPLRGQSLLIAREVLPGPNVDLIGVINGSNPMLIVVPSFTMLAISQSHPFPGYLNTFTCSIKTNVNLALQERTYLHQAYPGNSIIVLSGFKDAQGQISIALGSTPLGNNGNALFSSEPNGSGNGSTAAYDAINGVITLYLHRNQTMLAHMEYVVEFQLSNPDYEQERSRVITAQVTGSANISVARLPPPSQVIFGILNGTDPLVLVRPVFKTCDIRQSSPITGLTNTLTIAFSSSFDLAHSHAAAVTITGVRNAIIASTSVATVGNGSALFSDGFGAVGHVQYEQDVFTLSVAPGKTVLKDTVYQVELTVTNPYLNQPEGIVSASATCRSERFTQDGSLIEIPAQRMRVPNETILGVAHGSNPLQVVIPSFACPDCRPPLAVACDDVQPCARSVIAQSDPLVGKFNIISVTLVANVNLAATDDSTITVSGLQNAILSESVTLDAKTGGNDGHLLFVANFQNGHELVLAVAENQTMVAETTYQFSFNVTNPDFKQPAPAIRIQATGTAVFNKEPLAVPHLPITGVINGSDVMLIERPKFTIKAMAQSMPLAFYTNVFTVTLQSNVNLAHDADPGDFLRIARFLVDCQQPEKILPNTL